MLKKLCRCGVKIPITEKQCDTCEAKYNQQYDKHQRRNSDFYKSSRWKKLTRLCKEKFNGLDIYQMHKYNRIVEGTLSHHIVPVEDNYDLIYDLDNLIWLSDKSHAEIHSLYEKDKAKIQLELQRLANGYL